MYRISRIERAMKTEAIATPQASDQPSFRGICAAIGRWSPTLAVFIATVRVDRMDELERLHDAYSID
jgi:hypothetical protein